MVELYPLLVDSDILNSVGFILSAKLFGLIHHQTLWETFRPGFYSFRINGRTVLGHWTRHRIVNVAGVDTQAYWSMCEDFDIMESGERTVIDYDIQGCRLHIGCHITYIRTTSLEKMSHGRL